MARLFFCWYRSSAWANAAGMGGGVRVGAGSRRDVAERDVDPVVAGQLAPALAGLAGDPGCLVEAGEHGQQPGATHQQPGMRVLGKERVEGAQRLVCGPRPVRERGIEAEELRVALSVEAGVAECLLRHVRPVFEAAAGVRDCAERVPGVHQAAVVLCLLERRQDLPRESLEL